MKFPTLHPLTSEEGSLHYCCQAWEFKVPTRPPLILSCSPGNSPLTVLGWWPCSWLMWKHWLFTGSLLTPPHSGGELAGCSYLVGVEVHVLHLFSMDSAGVEEEASLYPGEGGPLRSPFSLPAMVGVEPVSFCGIWLFFFFFFCKSFLLLGCLLFARRAGFHCCSFCRFVCPHWYFWLFWLLQLRVWDSWGENKPRELTTVLFPWSLSVMFVFK